MKRLTLVTIVIVLGLNTAISAAMIKVGDVLDINVMSGSVPHAEFSGRYKVGHGGTIDYPLLADNSVVNLSTSELMNDLTFRLARHIENPLVLVSIVEKPEIAVTVLGQVVTPGPVKAYQGVTLQEVVQLAGGPNATADISRVKISNRASAEAQSTYDLRRFLQDGNMEGMPLLENGDVVVVLSQERTKNVKVIGAVQKPGFFALEDTMNIFEVIYLAGGPAEKADLSRVRRLSQSDGKTVEEVLDIQSYIDKGQMDRIPRVSAGDIVIIYTRWFDWRTVLSVLNNTLLFLVTIQAFAGVIK